MTDVNGQSSAGGAARVVACENRGDAVYLWIHSPNNSNGWDIVVDRAELLAALVATEPQSAE